MGLEAEARAVTRPFVVVLGLLAMGVTTIGTLGASGCTPDCEEKADLTAMDGWTLLAAEDDPFNPPADAPLCSPEDINVAPFGSGGPLALDVDTRAGCGWATLSQPTLLDIKAGDGFVTRVFYFAQTSTSPAVANVVLRIGDDDVLAFDVPLPIARGDLEFAEITFDHDVPAGTTALFHVNNHGDNTWNLLEMSRVRPVYCTD
jgi:hypothetical protein